jgi:hypothetical protein
MNPSQQATRLALPILVIPSVLIVGASGAQAADNPPSAPRDVQACSASAAATVTWRPPRNSGSSKVDQYKVVVKVPTISKQVAKVGAKRRSLTVSDLTPGTTYTFTVSAHNADGWGPASKAAKARPPLDGFGTVAGSCGVVATELGSSSSSMFSNRFDFNDDPFDATDVPLLTAGAQTIWNTASAGGSSALSETLAFETLARSEGASLVKTGTEIVYDQIGDQTDLSVQIAGDKVGVSVARAFSFPLDTPFTQEQASALLTGKLEAIQQSTENVSAADAWVKQILVVWAPSDANAAAVNAAWDGLSGVTKGDTILYVIVTDGSDTNVYLDAT